MAEFLEKVKTFFKGPQGKWVAIGVSGLVFLIIVLVVVVTLIGRAPEPEVTISIPQPAARVEGKAEETTAPPIKPLDEGFEVYSAEGFKDPFAPLTTETTETTGEAAVDISQVYLKAIRLTDEGYEAEFLYNGQNQVASVGETLPDSPYQVIEIGDDWVKLLYGDDTVVLTLGGSFEGLK
jgi:hypothetical protein